MQVSRKLRRRLFLLAIGLALLNAVYQPFQYRPELTRDLPKDLAQASVQFGERVAAQFPDGTQEATLLAVLNEQKFKRHGSLAAYSVSKFPCRHTWQILWENEGSTVRDVTGSYGTVCL